MCKYVTFRSAQSSNARNIPVFFVCCVSIIISEYKVLFVRLKYEFVEIIRFKSRGYRFILHSKRLLRIPCK